MRLRRSALQNARRTDPCQHVFLRMVHQTNRQCARHPVYFDQENVEFVKSNFETFRLISDAGQWIETEFCKSCGTTVTWTLEFLPGKRGIAGGTFDQPSFWYRPERYVFTRSKPDWLEVPSGITTCEAMPGSASE